MAALCYTVPPAADGVRLGVFLHGLAGDIACERFGEESLTAGDIINAIPEAFKRLKGQTL